jgi:hypothetical protein
MRESGYTFSEPRAKLGASVRWYDLFGGYHGEVGDTILWRTPIAKVGGTITETGWENRPLPTYWMKVTVNSVEPTDG